MRTQTGETAIPEVPTEDQVVNSEPDPVMDDPRVQSIMLEARDIVTRLLIDNGNLKAALGTIRAGYVSIHQAKKIANEALGGKVLS